MYKNKKLLLVMRHAKSDRSDSHVSDFDRPLNERGQREPTDIAKRLNDLRIAIDRAVISPARRTSETWHLLDQQLSEPPEPYFEPRLYNAYYQDVLDVLFEHAHQCDRLLLIAHCPAVIEITEFLSGEVHDFRTCCLAILSARTDKLSECISKPNLFRFEEMVVPRA